MYDPRYQDEGGDGPEDSRDFGVGQAQRERRAKREHEKYMKRAAEKMAAQIWGDYAAYAATLVFVKMPRGGW